MCDETGSLKEYEYKDAVNDFSIAYWFTQDDGISANAVLNYYYSNKPLIDALLADLKITKEEVVNDAFEEGDEEIQLAAWYARFRIAELAGINQSHLRQEWDEWGMNKS